MGKETARLIKHNLTTSDIHILAAELAVVFKKNVRYGYNLTFEWEKFQKGEDPSYDFVEQGIALFKDGKEEMRLTKDNHCLELFLNEYGEDILNNPIFNTEEGGWIKEEILNSKNELSFELNDWEAKFEYIANIYIDSLYCWLSEERTYWIFCKIFAFKDEFDTHYPKFEALEGLRHENMELCNRLYNSLETIIFCEETETYVISEWALNKMKFDDIKAKTKEVFGKDFLNISEFMLNEKFKNLPMGPEHVHYNTPNKEQVISDLQESIPLVFLEDYKDIIGTKKPESTRHLPIENWFVKPLDEITKELDKAYSTGCGTENSTNKYTEIMKTKEHLSHFHIAGFTYYEGSECFQELEIGTELKLEIEPDNKFDARAVAIYFNEFKLGFVPRSDNRIIYKLFQVGLDNRLTARIQAKDGAENPERQIQVVVHLLKESK